MGKYKLKWKRSATKEFRKLPKEKRLRILKAVEKLVEDPSQVSSRKLVNSKNDYRIRIGEYRVIYKIYRDVLVIQIIRVRHRKDVYRR